jgi:hypothetical protein
MFFDGVANRGAPVLVDIALSAIENASRAIHENDGRDVLETQRREIEGYEL